MLGFCEICARAGADFVLFLVSVLLYRFDSLFVDNFIRFLLGFCEIVLVDADFVLCLIPVLISRFSTSFMWISCMICVRVLSVVFVLLSLKLTTV